MSSNMRCPYNASHQVPAEKFIWHVTKCMKQNPNCKEIQCPYNPSHLCSPDQYKQHVLSDCEQKPSSDQIRRIEEYNTRKKEKKRKNFGDNKKNGNKKGGKNRSEGRRDKESEDRKDAGEEVKIEEKVLEGKEGFGLVKKKLVKPEDKNEAVAKEREGDCKSSIF